MGRLVCVVDDDDLVRETIALNLQDMGFETVALAEGAAVAETIAQRPFDALVVDVLMPGMDGYAVIKQVRQVRPDMRIVAISGGGPVEPSKYLHLASLLGVDATLSKPFGREDLRAALG
jgi:CheY-like chemotaxis protein